MSPPTQLAEALANAERGWRVFPVHGAQGGRCTCNKTQCGTPAKHPRIMEWQRGASRDGRVIRAWWTKWPQANVGVATGRGSGLLVLDVDPDKGGADSLRELEAEHGPLPETPISLTGGGGEHYLFSYPPGQDVRNSAGQLGDGLDVRGEGGYMVAPASTHTSGRRYEWDAAHSPDDTPLAPLPAWLLDAMTAAPSGNGAQPRLDTAGVLAGVPEGQRDAALFRLASKLRHADVPRASAEELVLTAAGNCDPPFSTEDVLAKVANAYGRYTPRANGAQPDDMGKHTAFHRTDAGNAALFAHLYGSRLRYDHRRRRWLVWAGHYWQPDAIAEVRQLAKAAARYRLKRAASIEDLDRRKHEVKWAFDSERRSHLDAAIYLAQDEPPIADAGDGWDADPWLLNVGNGTIDLHTGELRKHRQGDRITKLVPTDYDPGAKCPTWDAFLDRIFGGRQELVEYLKRLVGYSMTGDVSEQIIILLIGRGSNGKSTLEELLLELFADYATMAAPGLLLTSRNERHPTELADLYGRRFVMSIEVGEGKRLAETLVKQLSGSDTIKARRMNEDFWSFRPTHQLWLAANYKPVIKGTDLAIWRRIRLLPFDVVIPPEERNKKLPNELRAELPGILAWAVRGCLAWQKDGLEPPKAVTVATAAYQEESDLLVDFLSERCVVGDDSIIQASTLYKAYTAWAEGEGLRPRDMLSATMFGRRMAARFPKEHKQRGWFYVGIGLSDSKVTGLVTGFESNSSVLPLKDHMASRRGGNLEKPVNPSYPSPGDEDGHCKDCEAEVNYYDSGGVPWCVKHGPGPAR